MASNARKAFFGVLIITALAQSSVAAELPAGKGRETFQKVCTACHDVETTVNLRNSRSGWTGVVREMRNNGAEGTEMEFSAIIDYLTLNFGKKDDGSAKSSGRAGAAEASSRPTATPLALRAVPWEKNRLQTGRAIYRENCIVCHDVVAEKSTKVGPSFYHLFQGEKMPHSSNKPDRTYIAGKVRVGGPLMPAFAQKLTSADIEMLLDYLQTQ